MTLYGVKGDAFACHKWYVKKFLGMPKSPAVHTVWAVCMALRSVLGAGEDHAFISLPWRCPRNCWASVCGA